MTRSSRARFFPALVLLNVLFMTLPASGEPQQKPLEFGFIHFPPFGYLDDEGHPEGYLVALSRRVFRAMDQPVTLVQHPATRLYRQLDSGDIAFTLGAAKLQRLADTAIETEEAAKTLTLALYRRKNTEPVSDIESLSGERLVLMSGYSYGRLGKRLEEEGDAIQTIEARTHKSALRMIQFGRADYLLNYMTPADATIAQNKLSGLQRDVLTRVDVHLYVSKAVNNARALARNWDQNLKALKRNNQLPHTDYYEMGE